MSIALPHSDLSRALATGTPVYLPVNPSEYHGPHLPLHNDAYICAGLTRDIHASLRARHPEWPFLQAADLNIGVDPVPGPGSEATSYSAACRRIRDACLALVDLGARRVVLMTFHGSPMHAMALESGRKLLRRAGVEAVCPFNAVIRQVIAGDAEQHRALLELVGGEEDRRRLAGELRYDLHAGFGETSLALHYAPETVSSGHRHLPPCPPVIPHRGYSALARAAARIGRPTLADDLNLAAFGVGWYALEPFPGYTSRPHLASAEVGRAVARKIVDGLSGIIEDFFSGRGESPKPVLAWTREATLGGRLNLTSRPGRTA